MKEWRVEIEKITDERLLHVANGFTSGKESQQSLLSAYRFGHSTIRTQIFLVKLYNIPQYVAYHFRTHFSLYPMAPEEYGWMKSKRVDKGGGDFRDVCAELAENLYDGSDDPVSIIQSLPDNFDRYAPTDFAFLVSAEGLMNMASKRLCVGAVSKETREVMEDICHKVKDVDPDLYPHLVKPCVMTGICREPKSCGFNKSELFRKLRTQYKLLFV
ncbi:hypothetical protein [Clavibacter sp.]|uniref:hypothetical protein n=1 Tax=Clavibacter sp. TaxID=1871044 RepID=UPI0019B93F2B|nr:hypothetical protein [Clavibacter sp.]MBD5381990.1 hypothetical protein [Clavibacter sp.]